MTSATMIGTIGAATSPRHKVRKPNSSVYKRLAGDYPGFMLNDDGSLEELTHQERAILQFWRRLPPDMQPHMTKAMTDDGRPFEDRLAEFRARLQSAGWRL